jgi:Protein of unknown function (DUF2892)
MFFALNLPRWERNLRIAIGVAGAIGGCAWWGLSVPGGVAIVSGFGLAATGLIGFCPACALTGRRATDRSR